MKKAKSGMSGLNASETIVRARYTLSRMAGNPLFPNPPYPISEIDADVTELASFNQQVVAGNHTVTPLRDNSLVKVHQKMEILVGYVNGEAKGDINTLESSGFELRKTPTPATVPAMVSKATCENTAESSTVRSRWTGVKGRNHYIVAQTYTPQDESSWVVVERPTKTHCLIYGLEVGKFSYFRVCAINSAGQGRWSDATKLMVS